ncbi:COMM domain-containing protein 5 [Carassius auratus]|uniref:COMM domain-containing protein 5 n=1 Tax=Carassius auratus TaxID=7957 RepID=A0A6P6QQ85_CARAU|nr:COMM domain-containing protein 5-like [Carassius auratus]XP_052431068.1 COMM domain-containing protein 5 [Carassius gibelio]
MADSVSLFGGRAPAEVQQLQKHLRTLDRDTFTQMLSAVLKAVDGLDCRESLRLISESGLVSEESFNHVVAGLYTLLKEALCLPSLKQEVFNEDLRALRISEEFITDVSSAVFGNRQSSIHITDTHRGPTLAKIQDFKWRVDVAISTSSLSRALQPSILMQMKLSDGRLHRFEVPVVKFQELRYNVSLILKEMNDIEKRSILKIQD